MKSSLRRRLEGGRGREGVDGRDYYEEEYQQHGQHGQENYTLMESTLDDDQANAMFEPEG